MQASKVSLPYKHSVEIRLFWTEQTPEVSVVLWNCLINPIGNVYIYIYIYREVNIYIGRRLAEETKGGNKITDLKNDHFGFQTKEIPF